MHEDLELLIEIQESIIDCRRAAADLPAEAARKLLEIADLVEAIIREADKILLAS